MFEDGSSLSEYALDGLRQVMAVKSRVVLPFLVPQVSKTNQPPLINQPSKRTDRRTAEGREGHEHEGSHREHGRRVGRTGRHTVGRNKGKSKEWMEK